jgi:hypothetical protein
VIVNRARSSSTQLLEANWQSLAIYNDIQTMVGEDSLQSILFHSQSVLM